MSKDYFRYWGKAEKEGDGYHLLVYHCLDVAAVGHVLLKKSNLLLRRFMDVTGLDEATYCLWQALFLVLHDVGKFSESFQNLRRDLLRRLQGRTSILSYSVRHDSLGFLLWDQGLCTPEKLAKWFGIRTDEVQLRKWGRVLACLARAMNGHHGEPPKKEGENNLQLRLAAHFSQGDVASATRFVDDFSAILGLDRQMPEPPPYSRDLKARMEKASWLLAGFVVLCDWIGSNSRWFPFQGSSIPLADYWHGCALPQAERALREAGIGAASPAESKSAFVDLFPTIREPTPMQCHVSECSVSSHPQLFILEDVTGSGKTEAALFLVRRLMTYELGDGVFMALPTMATSNAMYERMAKTYRRLFAEGSHPSLVLAHSARHLSATFVNSIGEPTDTVQTYGSDDEVASSQCASWLADNRKKSLLADVGVGTLDQALLAILPSRFQSLRLFGLARHILIVDEVHAYDPYMNKLLQTLLSFQAALGGSAILLSATLPLQVRQEMLNSFARGLGMEESPRAICSDYPLVTHFSATSGLVETPVPASPFRRSSVVLKLGGERKDIERVIIEASRQGKCVCWIRNTVYDALAGYESLRPRMEPHKLMLFHARFAMGDRLDIESAVCTAFGRSSGEKERKDRVLIATQVVEQSLDLDFDMLISDLAPMDLLIQRVGRLHRHRRDEKGIPLPYGDRADQRDPPYFFIHAPAPVDGAGADWYEAAFPKAAFVYPSHGRLWLTARLLRGKEMLRMPEDARELIEAAFSEEAEDLIPVALRQRDLEAEAQWQADRSLAHINMLKLEEGYRATPNQWREEMRTPTRLGDMESTVRLARWDGTRLTPWYERSDFPWDMSQVNIRSHFVSAEADHEPALKTEVEKLKGSLPDKGKWSILVPMTPGDDGKWHGLAKDGNGRAVVLTYDRATGISVSRKGG